MISHCYEQNKKKTKKEMKAIIKQNLLFCTKA